MFELLVIKPVITPDCPTVVLGGPTRLKDQETFRWPIWWMVEVCGVISVHTRLVASLLSACGLLTHLSSSEKKELQTFIKTNIVDGHTTLHVLLFKRDMINLKRHNLDLTSHVPMSDLPSPQTTSRLAYLRGVEWSGIISHWASLI